MPKVLDKCKLLKLNTKKNNKGMLTFIENKDIPFKIKRVYYLYGTDKGKIRGYHKHKKLIQLVICLNGKIEIILSHKSERIKKTISKKNIGILIFNDIWREIKFLKKIQSYLFWLLKNIRKKTTFMKSKKKILILGGSGFIGCNLRKFFSNKNIDTFNIDLISKISTPDKYLDFAVTNKTLKKNLAIFNLTNYINLISPNYIINLAANSHVDRSIDTPKKIIKNNLNIVKNILEALRNTKKKINFIHISTDEVFGSIKKKSTNEKDYLNPSSPYSSSKAAADLIIESYIKTYKLPCSILRLSNNYGPFQNPEKFIPNSIFHLIINKKIPIYGNGKHIREWTYRRYLRSDLQIYN